MSRDWTAFARRVLRPGRPRLPEARAVVIGMTDVREAWEALMVRGLVPTPEHDPRGAFRERPAAADGPTWQPFRDDTSGAGDGPALPVAIDAAVTLACDPRGVAQAGDLALAFAAQSAAWEAPSAPRVAVTRVAWRVVAAERWYQSYLDRYRMAMIGTELSRLLRVRASTLASARAVRVVLDVTGKGYALRVADDAAACELWTQAVTRDLRRPDGAAYRELGDPTATMIDLWATGYALDHIRGDTVVLVAPAL